MPWSYCCGLMCRVDQNVMNSKSRKNQLKNFSSISVESALDINISYLSINKVNFSLLQNLTIYQLR